MTEKPQNYSDWSSLQDGVEEKPIVDTIPENSNSSKTSGNHRIEDELSDDPALKNSEDEVIMLKVGGDKNSLGTDSNS